MFYFEKKKLANSIGEWTGDDLFVRISWSTLPFLFGVASHFLDKENFEGTDEEIEQALNTLREQLSEVPMTQEEICNNGATFQLDQATARSLEVSQGNGLPSPWEFMIGD